MTNYPNTEHCTRCGGEVITLVSGIRCCRACGWNEVLQAYIQGGGTSTPPKVPTPPVAHDGPTHPYITPNIMKK